ncbi:hypothetical protein DPMN_074643 [Dreissena polymorpha]|uniref:Uncharacterized protein n=1 Tax=Dreissena polymorpha TaxID=45954 RepID=A0A9D3YJ08_DREPO|nr:hypothetical protein DPMN_074643 [Dreissena polymorpha]
MSEGSALDNHADGASVEHEKTFQMSAACKTLANVRINAVDSLADSNCSNKTRMDHTNTLTVATASSEKTQQTHKASHAHERDLSNSKCGT